MSERILDIFERSGDANIGQTLLRLAGLAEPAHRFEAATRPLDQGKGQRRVEHMDPRAGNMSIGTDAAPARTEVGS